MSIYRATAKPKFFKAALQKGSPLSTRGLTDGINNMAKAIENIELQVTATGLSGDVEWKNGILRIIIKDA